MGAQRTTSKGRNKGLKRRSGGAPARQASEKILRIGVIHNGRIIEERLISAGTPVTVGEHQKNTLVIPPGAVPGKRFELFTCAGSKKGYSLRFTTQMHGKVAVGGAVDTLASLGKSGKAKKKSNYYEFLLGPETRGKVYVGDYTFLFQFVTPPPQPVRPRTQDFRAWRWDDVDWIFLALLLLSTLLHTAAVVWIESHPPPNRTRLEDFDDRFVKLLLNKPDEPDPVAEPEEPVNSDLKVDTPAEPEPEPDKGGEEEQPEEVEDPGPAETEEEKDARLEEEVSSKGLLAMIGTTGKSSSAQKVKDLVGDAGNLSDDVGKALAESSGVKVARRDADSAGLRSGGGGDGAASTGELGKAGAGTGGAVKKKATEIKGKVKASGAEIAGAQDTKSIQGKIRRYNGRIKACYERELKTNPDLAGKIRVAWEIDTSGRVSGVDIVSNSTGNAELASCVKKEVKKFRFGDQEDDIFVEGYNFVLSPG
jgi:outer membrane biosynthesis protein TonB